MDLLKEIGAILGFVAFGGLAVLTLLTFQQARHLRRLRDWAGRQPERAAAEADAAAERAGEATVPQIDRPEPKGPSRFDRLRGELAVRVEEFDRRSPVDVRILAAGLLAIVIGVGVATSGFGLIGEDAAEPEATTAASEEAASGEVEVAVFNGTAPVEGGVGVSGVADRAEGLVQDAGFATGAIGDAGSFPASVVMFEEGSKSDAKDLAASLDDALGETDVELMTPEVADLAEGAPVALVVGIDDQGI